MKRNDLKKTLVAGTVLGLGVGMGGAALAQERESVSQASDIVVTARRTEERLQDVPVSVTVFNQEQLSNRNITTPADLVTYTPSLSANVRYGTESATFSIRGFTQEQRTTASVATYFGEVVTPRGQGGSSITAGDGAGPGTLFDLQNLQVLNGPQGTLFGRNTTGGAVLLVPQRPRDELGGYAEFSFGDYNMERYQGVFNTPLGDHARLRIGMDRQSREGYLENQSGIGPSDFNDTNYEAYRIGFVADLAPNLENYTLAYYSHSLTHGTLSAAAACAFINPSLATGAMPQARACSDGNLSWDGVPGSIGTNNQDFYTVRNSIQDPQVSQNVWQAQNITTWDVSDNFTVKNVMSYGEYQGNSRLDFYGSYFVGAAGLHNPGYFAVSGLAPAFDASANRTYSEELQFSGTALDDRLTWQAGAYYEESDPQRFTGTVAQTYWHCNNAPGSDPGQWSDCAGVGSNRATMSGGGMHFQTQALYFQGDIQATEDLKFTLGYRYTWDRTDGESLQYNWGTDGGTGIADNPTCNVGAFQGAPSFNPGSGDCTLLIHNNTEAPTWVIGADYRLSDNDMLYTKYSRGYRQGSINLFAPFITNPPGNINPTDAQIARDFRPFKPEQLDAYEVGGKFGFDGPMPGILNVALFYNDLTDAQLQTGIIVNGRPTTAILNGDVTTYGAEVSAVIDVTDDLNLALAYGYMNTSVDRAPDLTGLTPLTVYVAGQSLAYIPENKFTATLTYQVPVSESIGDISVGATWSYIGESLLAPGNPAPYNNFNSYETLNLNFNWGSIFGSNVDGSVFVTNALDEEYAAYASGTLYALNYEVRTAAPPRMVGARLRYSFGGEAN